MKDLIIAVVGTLVIFALERAGVILATRSPGGRAWIRAHRLFHPNPISYMRMPMGLVTIFLWAGGWQVTAFLWFAFWMITDLTDGDIARSCDLVTESGKWIDPLSDKLLYFPVLIYLSGWQTVIYKGESHTLFPFGWILALVVIDSIGQCSRLFTVKKAANLFGKAKTALITIMIILGGSDVLYDLRFITPPFLALLAICCAVLAFLSFFCKIVPDSWYANTFTLGNFLCGISSIVCVSFGWLHHGFVLVFIGQFFDLFDGRCARKFGSTRYGALFDDIADGTSFGLATAFLLFVALGSTIPGFLVAAAFCVSVIVRLIRFLRLKGALPIGVFSGLPSPAGALLTGAAALLFLDKPLLIYFFAILSSVAMLAPIRYRHFAQKIWPGIPNIVKVGVAVAVIVFVSKGLTGTFLFADQLSIELGGFVLAMAYLIFGRASGRDDERAAGPPARGKGTAAE
ncbi:MAG: CDP-alcohol phosphatidyltransferase family protein [Lentisphaeria bacterium]|nr:CDP-alcohol phosphatidyltransferase family protein [Lentisphaeria bacterium]